MLIKPRLIPQAPQGALRCAHVSLGALSRGFAPAETGSRRLCLSPLVQLGRPRIPGLPRSMTIDDPQNADSASPVRPRRIVPKSAYGTTQVLTEDTIGLPIHFPDGPYKGKTILCVATRMWRSTLTPGLGP